MKINKVGHKIFLGMLALSSIIILIMTVLVKKSYTDSLKRNEINFHVQATSKTKYQFDLAMRVLDRTVRTISSRPEIIAALNSSGPQPETPGDFTINTYFNSLREIQPFLGNMRLLGANGHFYSSNLTLKKAETEALYKQYAPLFEAGISRDYFVEARSAAAAESYGDVLTGVWPVFDFKTQKLLGQIFLGLDYAIFQDMFILPFITSNEQFVMIDPAGTIVFSYPDSGKASFAFLLNEYPELMGAGEIIIEGTAAGVPSIIVSETSQVLNWKFIRIINAESVTNDTRKMQHYFTIVFVLSVIISLLFSLYVSHILTKPVSQFFEACTSIEKGDMSARVRIRSRDEMGQIGDTFNLIMDQINGHFERELAEQKRKNEMKLEILQAQINPHFLYNTLDSIKVLADIQEVHNVASMCAALISLLKYNLSSSSLATLREEAESVTHYVSIQKYRYGDIFDFKTDIAKETEQCIISRFVLQPLVENCLIHGFEDTENGGEIRIRSFFEGKSLCLEVIDNGSGMKPETVDKINRGVEQDKRFNNIGIHNIRERIHLQFGDKADLFYTGKSGEGTIARLIFPLDPDIP